MVNLANGDLQTFAGAELPPICDQFLRIDHYLLLIENLG